MSPRNATEIGQRRSYVFRGRTFPSVTTLLKTWPMEWAIAYGAKHVAERAVFNHSELSRRLDSDDPIDFTLRWLKAAPHERRDAAAGKGTGLHAYLEARMAGRTVPVETAPSPESQQAIEQFLSTYRPDPLFVEAQVFSVSEGYAGSADAFLRIYGRTYTFDLKTSNSASVDHKTRLQLAAYRYGDFIGEDDQEVAPVPTCDGALVLYVPRDDPRSWQLIETPAGAEEFRVFLAAKRLWEFYDGTKETGIGDLLLPQGEVA